ncbi:MAG: tripartite tricarboxylate transporter substrate binding protein, partial [Burkholderiaceae bacterium]|nr:tripartite tricarboxylate transporter substrate binding protein [Burkholderiaceae bacterium]
MTFAFSRARRMVALGRLAALACVAGSALAQQPAAYPTKPIQLIAQQPPGSGSDAMTRVWADCAAR